ncbi:chromobox protein homolog 1 [Galendromus occidentalis]|uniref:Chromobox protein homolog 1 n=1 Tax=Galendromus occidentalis TaxID=34638 RepID=A0AAJ6VV10_9ACAR|nr:chromobox protein homolog 1 [Galendromus occidentalis]XP_018497383.1 chromobox protein homolog 1 [Galendromus occidentalis]
MVDSRRRNKENKKENLSTQRKEVSSKQKQAVKSEQKDSSSELSSNGLSDGKSHQLEEIMGCTEWQGQLVFLIKWLNEPDPQVVPAAIANIKYPQRVIEFYEKRIVWDQNM